MEFADVLKLRPEGQDSASLAGAISRARTAQLECLKQVKSLAERRAAALLTAGDKELQAMEQEAADAQRAADRIDALMTAMSTEMEAASDREQKAEALRLLEQSNELATKFLTWWREEYPKHAMAIAAGLNLEAEAGAACAKADVALASAGLGRDRLIYTSTEITGSGSLWSLPMSTAFQLPSLAGTVWPGVSRDFQPFWFVQELRRMDIS